MPKIYKWFESLEDTPENPITRDRIVNWMATTGFIEGYIHKKISPMDRLYTEDYIQECWIQILEIPADKLVEIYRRGKGKLTNYIKTLINNNIRSNCSHLYRNIREDKKHEMYLDDTEWNILLEGNDSTTADVVFPTTNYKWKSNRVNRVLVSTEKVEIKADIDLYEEDNETTEG